MRIFSFFLTILIFFISVPLLAQRDLKVENFGVAETEFQIRAVQQQKDELDADGNHSALIIIKIPTVDSATFPEAHKMEYHNYLYYVWMSTYYNEITIYTKDFNPLIFKFAEPLESKKAYWMEVDVPQKEKIVLKTIRDTVHLDKKSKWSMEGSLVVGQALGAELDFSIRYFLIGIGADFFLGKTKGRMTETTLFNSGYTGNFLRQKKITLEGTCPHIYANIGAYFKYVSVICQVGVVFSERMVTDLSYSGNGEGVKDEYIDECFGEYSYNTIEKNFVEKKKRFFTISPVIKGYIPFNSTFGLAIGAGYTFIPAIAAGAGWGSVGVHIKFD